MSMNRREGFEGEPPDNIIDIAAGKKRLAEGYRAFDIQAEKDELWQIIRRDCEALQERLRNIELLLKREYVALLDSQKQELTACEEKIERIESEIQSHRGEFIVELAHQENQKDLQQTRLIHFQFQTEMNRLLTGLEEKVVHLLNKLNQSRSEQGAAKNKIVDIGEYKNRFQNTG